MPACSLRAYRCPRNVLILSNILKYLGVEMACERGEARKKDRIRDLYFRLRPYFRLAFRLLIGLGSRLLSTFSCMSILNQDA